MISTPYIVENQCGSIDISQSNDAKVIVSPYATRPPALTTLHLARDARIAGAILLERPRVEKVGQAVPDQEVERRSNEKERRVQIELLVLQHFVLRDDVGVRPDVEAAHAEEQSAGRAASSPASRAKPRRSAAG